MDDELAPLLGFALLADPVALHLFLCALRGAHLGEQRQELLEAIKRFSETAIMVLEAEKIARAAGDRAEGGQA